MLNTINASIIASLASLGNNFIQYNFQNQESYIFSFYINIVDNNIYMSISDSSNNPIQLDRQVVLSNNLFGNTQLSGTISVVGDIPSINTIDTTCNIFYNYKLYN